MFCDAYNKSLTEAATGGRELSSTLQRHLASCSDCRFAFAEEQSLFAAMNAGIHFAANPEVPSTLIPRIHVALNNEPTVQPNTHKLVFAGVAVASIFAFAVAAHFTQREISTLPKTAISDLPSSSSRKANEPQSSERLLAKSAPRSVRKTADPHLVSARVESPIAVEVLVPPGEGNLLRAYALSLTRSQRPTLVSATNMGKEIAPLDVEFLEITNLEIKPLAGGDSD